MHIEQAIRRITVLLAVSALAGCASGGGREGSVASPAATSPPPAPTSPPPAPPSPPQPLFFDIRLTGSVGVPAPASFGESPVPAQIAPPDGSNFETENNSAFPVLANSLQATSTGLSAVSSNQSATAIVTSTGKDTYRDPCTGQTLGGIGATIQLSIPSINLNLSWSTSDINNPHVNILIADSLTYVLLGSWEEGGSHNSAIPLQSHSWYIFGYETAANSMPIAGQASFTGSALGTVYTPTAGTIGEAYLDGAAAFSADFASGKITGAFTKLEVSPNGGKETLWNDVSVNASIAAGGNRFSGATAVTSTPQGLFTVSGSATGSINGAFYGPAAQNLGAIWTLSDGTTSAIGGVVAGH